METKFNFKSQVCTSVEQSRMLLALGLKKETADMHWFNTGTFGWQHCSSETYIEAISHPFKKEWATNGVILPAWSLGRLLEIMRMKASSQIVPLDDTFDRLIEGIETRIKEGYFNKDYLCEK